MGRVRDWLEFITTEGLGHRPAGAVARHVAFLRLSLIGRDLEGEPLLITPVGWLTGLEMECDSREGVTLLTSDSEQERRPASVGFP